MISKIFNSRFWFLIIPIILLVINWSAWQFHTRVDLTSEKRFTLSTATKKLLVKLDAPITIDVFLKAYRSIKLLILII